MTEEEIYEELEITYGKPPRTTSEKNMIWLKGVLEAHIIEGEFNDDVPKPSLDALAMTLIAITTYDIRNYSVNHLGTFPGAKQVITNFILPLQIRKKNITFASASK